MFDLEVKNVSVRACLVNVCLFNPEAHRLPPRTETAFHRWHGQCKENIYVVYTSSAQHQESRKPAFTTYKGET